MAKDKFDPEDVSKFFLDFSVRDNNITMHWGVDHPEKAWCKGEDAHIRKGKVLTDSSYQKLVDKFIAELNTAKFWFIEQVRWDLTNTQQLEPKQTSLQLGSKNRFRKRAL